MKTSILTLTLILLFGGCISAQPIPTDSLYLGQTPPGNTPVRFNLFVNTGSFAAERIAISNDGRDIYYSEVHSYYPTAGDTIRYYRYSGSNWTGPFNLFAGYTAPALSVGSDTMYFQNDTMYLPNNNTVYRTFFSVNNGSGWSNPKRLLKNLSSVHYFQETNIGNHYLSSIPNGGIGASDWCRLIINGADSAAKSLGLPVNSNLDDLDLYVSKDESYMIVVKYLGYVTSLYVSYHKSNGTWTNPKTLGSKINFGLGSWGPYVSADKKYLFYTAGTKPDYSDLYIYWIRIDSLIDSLMYTNYVPYVKNTIPARVAKVGEMFTFTIPDTTFYDDDSSNTLDYHAELTSGSPLPAWLIFDSISGTFSGIPDAVKTLNIKVKATDNAGASASTNLKITVKPPIPHDSLYFGQPPPGNTPKVFAPGIVSFPGRNEAVITFSPEGTSVFFFISKNIPYTMHASYSNDHWTIPDTIPFTKGRSTGEPFFAYNGSRLYMFATNAVNHASVFDLSYSEKQGANWSDPISLGNPPNSEAYQYHPCIVGDTSIYFSCNAGDICRCQYHNGAYQARVVLPVPVNHIGTQTYGDPFVSNDESYMILKSKREEGYGQNDLYIAYKKTDGTWTNPKNLGNIINTPGNETSGDITPDGLYMTYGRNGDLYWVSASFIDSLKHTNFLPYRKNPIEDKTDSVGHSINFQVPDTTFVDDDGNNTLTYSAKLVNGSPLPYWLVFDPKAATFSGIPPKADTLNIMVTAKDSA